MRRVGMLVMLLPACFTIPEYDGPGSSMDEDGDGIEDLQDQCPHINSAGAPQADSDNDGVGNGCDPDPGMQDIHVFYGFGAFNIGDLSTTGRVQPNDSFVEIGATGTDAYNGVTSDRALSTTQIDVRFLAIESVDTVDGGFGLRLGNYGPGDDDAGFCKIDLEPPDRLQLTATYKSPISGSTRSMTSGVTDLPFAGASGHLRGTLVGTELTCLIDQLATEHSPISISVTLDEPAVPGTPGGYARNSIVGLEYLFIVGLP